MSGRVFYSYRVSHAIGDLKTHAEKIRVAGKEAIHRLRNATETRGFVEFLRSW
jgi:hypothetical protein